MCKGTDVTWLEVFSKDSHTETTKNHKSISQASSPSCPRFELDTSRIKVRNVITSVNTLSKTAMLNMFTLWRYLTWKLKLAGKCCHVHQYSYSCFVQICPLHHQGLWNVTNYLPHFPVSYPLEYQKTINIIIHHKIMIFSRHTESRVKTSLYLPLKIS